jgi:hypothetical protein
VTKYLASFPELSEKDFPRFVEFDLNSDGKVSFSEWQEYLAQQKAIEAQKKESGESSEAFSDVLSTLYDKASASNSFASMDSAVKGEKKKNRLGAMI